MIIHELITSIEHLSFVYEAGGGCCPRDVQGTEGSAVETLQVQWAGQTVAPVLCVKRDEHL